MLMNKHIKKECPSGETRALNKSLAGDLLHSSQAQADLQALKRRRDAALRLPPLSSGRRDPAFNWERWTA